MENNQLTQLSRSLYETFNRHDLNEMTSMVSDNLDWLDVPMNRHFKGKDGLKQFVQNWWTGFPDAKVEIKNIIESKDIVVTEFIGRGTHTGVFMALGKQIPATSKKIEFSLCEVTRFQDGKPVSIHTYYDLISIARQLGLETQMSQLAAA